MRPLQIIVSYVIAAACITSLKADPFGGLYPRESESREVKSLDGIWDFRVAPKNDPDLGFRDKWFEQPLKLTGDTILMPVPSSYNDITQSKDIRDHVGWAWYDRQFYVPKRWIDDALRIVIRVGSAHYNSILYINGNEIMTHEVGHLPFSEDITNYVVANTPNLLTICINNTLTPLTIPQGSIIYKTDTQRYPEGYFTQEANFDFFNYAGIHRPVYIYTTPATYIKDVIALTSYQGTTGFVSYNVSVSSSLPQTDTNCIVEAYDENDALVSTSEGCSSQLTIDNVNLWWPYLMSEDPGYLYKLKVKVSDTEGRTDVHFEKIGIRTIGWNSTTFTINNVPVYLRGCGRHEDYNVVGKGMVYANIVKDFNLLKWLGANSFRTSHYPYAEEIMDLADEEGIMIIDESPGVNLQGFGQELLQKHISIMESMVHRDKNRPSVIMWSVANEANTDQAAAEDYFKQVTDFVRGLDPTRPVSAAINKPLGTDLAAQSMDVLMLNKYYAWYSDTGHTELIQLQTVTEFTNWFNSHNKPLMISEYGAGTIPGLHMGPAFTWSEEYQSELMIENFKAFDQLRASGYFFGEMIWNFADFATAQGTTRVGGNKKGLFTRERQPKTSAHILRERYYELANKNLSTTGMYRNMFIYH